MLNHQLLVKAATELLPSAKLVYLFGSEADGSSSVQSDIDLAVLLPQKLDPIARFEFQEKLAHRFSRDVDLVDLLAASTVLQHQIIQNGKLLWGEKNEQMQFEMQVLSMYQHLNEERSEILKQYQS